MPDQLTQIAALTSAPEGTLGLAPAGVTPIPSIADDGADSGGFGQALSRIAQGLVQPQQDAARAVDEFAQGADGELHKSMLTLERADITLKFYTNMRNKCLEAYREVMHMGS